MKMMRAAVVEKPEVVVVKEIPIPEVGDDEVLIKVQYTGICGSDQSIYRGKFVPEYLPLVSGHELSGDVAETGKNVANVKEGDRVIADINISCGVCFYCRNGWRLLCPEHRQLGIHTNGAFAEYVKAPARNVLKIPDSLDYLTASFTEPLSCIMHAVKAMDVKISSSVVVIGCRLGILHACAAYLRGAAPVILIGHNEKRLRIAKEMGVDVVINSHEVEDPVARVLELTEGRGADYVLESVGQPELYELAFRMIRPGGKVTAFGITAADETMQLKPLDFIVNEQKLAGSKAGEGNDYLEAMQLLTYNRIDVKKLFSMVVPLEEYESALHEMKENKDLIKVFVSPQIDKRIVY